MKRSEAITVTVLFLEGAIVFIGGIWWWALDAASPKVALAGVVTGLFLVFLSLATTAALGEDDS